MQAIVQMKYTGRFLLESGHFSASRRPTATPAASPIRHSAFVAELLPHSEIHVIQTWVSMTNRLAIRPAQIIPRFRRIPGNRFIASMLFQRSVVERAVTKQWHFKRCRSRISENCLFLHIGECIAIQRCDSRGDFFAACRGDRQHRPPQNTA